MAAYGGGAAAALTGLWVAGTSLWPVEPPEMSTRTATPDGSFLADWEVDALGDPPCQFYNGTYVFTHGLCNHFSIARMRSRLEEEARQRALLCAAHHETDCILSPEVGFSVPAAFVYDGMHGMRMLIAPKIVATSEDNTSDAGRGSAARTDGRWINLRRPDGRAESLVLWLQPTITVEYLEASAAGRRVTQDSLDGPSAYCVQLLRHAFEAKCWDALD